MMVGIVKLINHSIEFLSCGTNSGTN